MAIPGQTITLRDPGLGLGELGENTFVYFGSSSSGSITEVKSFSSSAAVVDEYGQGPLPDALCHKGSTSGWPVYACRLTGSTAGAAGAVTKTAAGSSTGTVTVAGAAYDRYEVIVEITTTGTLGTGGFRYSLDDGRTYSEEITIPAGATYAITSTNLTLTFVPGGGAVFFLDADLHEFDCTAPHWSTTELALGVTALTNYMTITPEFALDALILTGRNATGSAAATIAGALSTHMTTLAARFQYARAMMDSGSGDTRANVKTAFASYGDARVCLTYGDVDLPSSKPFAGFGAPKRVALDSFAARAAREVISTDLARVASGPLTGVLEISNDEFANQDMDSAKISTTRTHPLAVGFFITNARLKSATGSDYKYWQHGRIMDRACRTVAKAQVNFQSAGYATNSDGTIEESEAKRLEAIVTEALKIALVDPVNAEGRQGHVSDFLYRINRVNNFLSSETIMSKVSVRPLGYAKFITTELGYAADVGR